MQKGWIEWRAELTEGAAVTGSFTLILKETCQGLNAMNQCEKSVVLQRKLTK